MDPLASTGPSSYLRGLSQALSKLGCDVHILALNTKQTSQIVNNVKVHYISTFYEPFRRIPGINIILSPLISVGKIIDRFCKDYKIDIIHNSCAGFGTDRLVDIPSVTTCHGTGLGELMAYSGVPISFINPNLSIDIILTMLHVFQSRDKREYGDKTIAVSKSIADELVRFCHLPKYRVITIHNGIDLSRIVELREGEKSKEHAILSVSRFVWSKGHKFLIDAMPHILSEYPDAKLWLVGDFRPTRATIPLSQYIRKLGIKNSVIFTGKVSTEKLYYLYHKAEIFVQPSVYEPFGITILEAMSLQKPIVATNIGGIPEIITNGIEGILVEPRNNMQLADAILHMFSDSSKRRRLGINARKKVEREFTWEKIAAKTLKLYKSMTS
jgi:glycosyltransferase involved in cell wall biosynthesis